MNMNLFGKKLPAWLLLGALVIVGAGAATGLVLKDQITGTTTIAVSQALGVLNAPVTGAGDNSDEFLGTMNDDGTEWAVHFEANNGDNVEFKLELNNYAGSGNTVVAVLTLDNIPDGMTVNMEGAASNIVRLDYLTWKFPVTSDGDDTLIDETITVTIALEDAQPTGFYEINSVIVPVNV